MALLSLKIMLSKSQTMINMLPMNFPLYKATMDVYNKNNDNFDFRKSESFKAAIAEAVQQAMGDDGARRERHGLKTSLGKCNRDLKSERAAKALMGNDLKAAERKMERMDQSQETARLKITELTEERDGLQKKLAELGQTVEVDLRNEREARQRLDGNLAQEKAVRLQMSDNLKELRGHLTEVKARAARDVAANQEEIARLHEERAGLKTELAECREKVEKGGAGHAKRM